MKMKRLAGALSLLLCLSVVLSSCQKDPEESKKEEYQNKPNKYIGYSENKVMEEGMYWPEDRVIPTMATPEKTLDAISVNSLSSHEKTTYAYLQGIVNKKKPRIYLKPDNVKDPWDKNLNLELNLYRRADKYELLKKYKDEVKGIVLYNRKTSAHYVNLACSIAGIKGGIPVDISLKEKLDAEGITFEILEDLTGMTSKDPIEIYNYYYDTYWKDCQKTLLFSLSPTDHLCQVRDMAAATGGAIVWYDNEKEDQKAAYGKFLKDLTPGKSLVTGWYTEERSGIGAAAEYGLSTVPSDYFENSTVLAGMDHTILRKAVPNKPELENKVYIAIFLSDGDNVQYVQHKMHELWMNPDRGTMPINWTTSPSLVDFAPGMLNYYYATATENDFFASGPSGMGYSLLIDELNSIEKKQDIVNLKDPELAAKYAQLTQQYQQRAGYRVITMWDLVNDVHMNAFEQNTRYIYGSTYQNWAKLNRETYFTNNRLPFIPNTPCYAMDEKEIIEVFSEKVKNWDGNSPLFLSAQGNAWFMTPAAMKKIQKALETLAPDKVEILRGDHFFALLSESNGTPFDLSISEKLSATASSNSEAAALTIDGNPTGDSIWVASEKGEQALTYDLGGEYTISRYVLRHAGDNGMEKSKNTQDYTVEVSMDNSTWTLVDDYRGNTENVTDIDIDPVPAKYLRVTIKKPGSDDIARIADIEIYGSVAK